MFIFLLCTDLNYKLYMYIYLNIITHMNSAPHYFQIFIHCTASAMDDLLRGVAKTRSGV